MEKIKLEDVNILIDEYDEMMMELQRDNYNLYKNSIIPLSISIVISLLISHGNIYTITFFIIFPSLFFLIFLISYNFFFN